MCSLEKGKRRATVAIKENVACFQCVFAFMLYLCIICCTVVRLGFFYCDDLRAISHLSVNGFLMRFTNVKIL